MLEGEVKEIEEEFSKFFRGKCPFIRVMVPKRGESRVQLHGKALVKEELDDRLLLLHRSGGKGADEPDIKAVLLCYPVPLHGLLKIPITPL